MTEQILRCRRPIRILAAALALAMTLAMTLACVPRAQAYMWPAGDQNLNIKCYTLSAGNTAVYSTKNCTVKCGTVFGSDLITLLNACGDAIQISYPISGGRTGYGWIKASALSPGDLNNSFSLRMKVSGKLPLYRRSTGDATVGTVFAGDEVFLVAADADHEKGRAQIIMPVSGGWKMGWASFRDIERAGFRAIGGGQVIEDGQYKIYVSPSHCLDGDDPNNVHVWQALTVPQQEVLIRHCGNGLYAVIFCNNGLYLDKQGGGSDPSVLQGYPNNATDAQRFFIADLGGGRYEFFTKSGLALDVDHYQTSTNGTRILAWYYNGQSVTLKKLDSGPMKRTQSSAVNGGSGNIQVAGVDIGYRLGQYFTDNGSVCSGCHGKHAGNYATNESYCNCKCTAIVNGRRVELGGIQCLGFARYVQSVLYGGRNEYNAGSSFCKVSGSHLSGSAMSAAAVKRLITSAGVGAHIRTAGSQHSMIVTSVTSSGFTVIQANGTNNDNYSGHCACRIGQTTYTWNSYIKSTYGQRGLDYIMVFAG